MEEFVHYVFQIELLTFLFEVSRWLDMSLLETEHCCPTEKLMLREKNQWSGLMQESSLHLHGFGLFYLALLPLFSHFDTLSHVYYWLFYFPRGLCHCGARSLLLTFNHRMSAVTNQLFDIKPISLVNSLALRYHGIWAMLNTTPL